METCRFDSQQGGVCLVWCISKIVQLYAESALRKLRIFNSADGTIYRYNIHIEPNMSMGKECFEQNVVECVFWGNGVVCLTERGQFICIFDFKTMKPSKLPDVPGLAEDDLLQPICLTLREPKYTMSGIAEVLVAVGDDIFVVEEDMVQTIWFDEPSVEDSEMQN